MCLTASEPKRPCVIQQHNKTEAEMERLVTLLRGSCSSWNNGWAALVSGSACQAACLLSCSSRSPPKLAEYFKQNQNWHFLTGNMADVWPHKRAASECVCCQHVQASYQKFSQSYYTTTMWLSVLYLWPWGACFQFICCLFKHLPPLQPKWMICDV